MKIPDLSTNDAPESRITIVFNPTQKKCVVASGTSLIEAATAAGITLDGVCGHKGTCGHCRVKIVTGTVTPGNPAEKNFFSPQQVDEGWVLGCQRQALSDLEIVVKNDINDAATTNSKPLDSCNIKRKVLPVPWIKKEFVALKAPTLADQKPDLERLLTALGDRAESINTNILPDLPETLRRAGFGVTATIFNHEIINLESGNQSAEQYGIALDIGTTTVAAYIANLKNGELLGSASAINQQAVFGADVISRINAVKEEKDGLNRLHKAVITTINQVIAELLAMVQLAAEHIYLLTAVGNTTMSHLLLGVSPVNIARAPFIPAFGGVITASASALGIALPDYTKLLVLENIAGYVGSDTVAVALATATEQQPGIRLTVDIGTNGEIILATESRLLVCSTAAGPAFEGGGIKCGMRAIAGAIAEVSIDNENVNFSVLGDAEPMGLCGSGIIDAVSEMVRIGLLRNNGWIKSVDECPDGLARAISDRIIIDDNGRRFVLVQGENEIAIYQKDIRNLQLAKGAIRAGIDVLCRKMNISGNELDGILLAGAFGNNLRVESLLGIDMLPTIEATKIKFIGHAAGLGAYRALVSQAEMEKSRSIAASMEHIELSSDPDFQNFFADSVNFHPHCESS